MDYPDNLAASNNNFPKFSQISCHVPEMEVFISALKTKLEGFFETVTVEFVECPDLTQPPYRFIAPGLCGNTGQLILGNFGDVYPFPKSDRIYNFKKLLSKMERDKINTFLLGSSLCFSVAPSAPIAPQKVMCTVSMNALFSPKINKEINVTNKSCGAFVVIEKDDSISFRGCQSEIDIIHNKSKKDNENTRALHSSLQEELTEESSVYALDPIREKKNTCILSCILNNPNPECIMRGRFFISEGQRGQVLKIHVKKRINQLGFISALKQSLLEIKGPTNLPLGLGGTFVMSGGNAKTIVLPKFPPIPLDTGSAIHGNFYKNVTTESLVAVGAVNSEFDPKYTFSTFKQYEACGIFDDQNSYMTEYLGYFSLIESIYEFWHEPTNLQVIPPKEININLQAHVPM